MRKEMRSGKCDESFDLNNLGIDYSWELQVDKRTALQTVSSLFSPYENLRPPQSRY